MNSFPRTLQLLDFFPFPWPICAPCPAGSSYNWLHEVQQERLGHPQIAPCISEKRKRDLMIRTPPSSFSSLCLSPLMHPTSEKTPFSHRKEAGEGAQFSPDWADKWRKEQVSTTITLYTVAKIRTFGVSR